MPISHLSRIVLSFGITQLATAAALPAQSTATPASGALGSVAPPARFTDPARREKLRAAIPRIDSLMRSFAAQRRVPGWAYGIIIDGQLEHVVAGGLRNVERNAATDTATVFRIASMSKTDD